MSRNQPDTVEHNQRCENHQKSRTRCEAAEEDVDFLALEITNRAGRTLAVVPFVDSASGPANHKQ